MIGKKTRMYGVLTLNWAEICRAKKVNSIFSSPSLVVCLTENQSIKIVKRGFKESQKKINP